MDVIYRPEGIPSDYNFCDINNDYIDFYNKGSFRDETAIYYRVYNNYPGLYETLTRNFGNYNLYTFQEYKCSSDFVYRTDFPEIMFCSVTFIIIFLFLFNLITSIIKKGGIFHGLL